MTPRIKKALCFTSLLFSTLHILASEPNTLQLQPIRYKEVGHQILTAIGFVEQGREELTEQEKDEIREKIPQLNEAEKLKLVFELFDAAEQSHIASCTAPEASHQALRSTIKELELFYSQGTDPKNHLFSKLNYTNTILGQATLAKMLVEPITDIQTLRNRQAFIRELVNNKQLFAQLDSQLSQLAHKESDLFSFWEQQGPFSQLTFANLQVPPYMAGKTGNFNTSAINAYRSLMHIELAAFCAGALAWSYFEIKGLTKSIPNRSIQSKGFAYYRTGWALLSTVGLPIIAINQFKKENHSLRYLHTKLSGVMALLQPARTVHQLPTKNPGLFLQHAGIEHLEQQGQFVQKLLNNLETKTFTEAYSWFSNTGRIMATFNLMEKYKNEFVGLMQAVGEVDACLSIAKLYKSLQENSNATYCFVDYVEQDTPYLHLENFWNPIIDPSVVVTNSIELGGTQSPHNIVVTGSNTGGKSTILKAVVANIMLSRLGIAPARVAVMTPFTYLATSMNIGDDTAGGVSLFKAEVLRAKNILNNVKSLQPNQFAFLAIDELFVGTASEKGEEAACKFAETLNALPNTMFTFATHFKKATTLEQRTNGTCKNYMVEAYKDESGTIVRPFKLEAGISTSNIANDILQENISSIDFLESSVDVLA